MSIYGSITRPWSDFYERPANSNEIARLERVRELFEQTYRRDEWKKRYEQPWYLPTPPNYELTEWERKEFIKQQRFAQLMLAREIENERANIEWFKTPSMEEK